MKKYKTWEAFKMLEENPKNKFTCFDNKRQMMLVLSVCDDGFVSITYDKNKSQLNSNINDEWALVQEPVDFIEAMKAYREGKNIYCLWGGYKYFYVHDKYGNKLIDIAGTTISISEILEGKWYIQEDEE
jgi:hypothetical protein